MPISANRQPESPAKAAVLWRVAQGPCLGRGQSYGRSSPLRDLAQAHAYVFERRRRKARLDPGRRAVQIIGMQAHGCQHRAVDIAEFGRIRAEFRRAAGRTQSKSGGARPNSRKFDFDRPNSPNLGQLWPAIGQISPNLRRIGPTLHRVRPASSRFSQDRPNLGRFRPNLGLGLGLKSSEFGKFDRHDPNLACKVAGFAFKLVAT